MDRESAHPQAPSEMPGTDAEGRNGKNKDTGSLKLGGESDGNLCLGMVRN